MKPIVHLLELVLFCGSLIAQDASHSEGEPKKSRPMARKVPATVVTVSATPLPLNVATASVTVKSASDTKGLVLHDASDLLGIVPGLHVSRSAPFGPGTVYQMGGDPNFTLILLDGIP